MRLPFCLSFHTPTLSSLLQVNHIKLDSDQDPLHFAERLLHSASQTVTLSIKRQASLTTPPQTKPHTPLMSSRSHTPGGTLESLYSILPSLSGATSPLPSLRARPHNLLPHLSNVSINCDCHFHSRLAVSTSLKKAFARSEKKLEFLFP